MDNEFVIFERFFEQNNNVDAFFIRLSCESDIELSLIYPKSITFVESFDSLYPIMLIDFIDGSGDFFGKSRLDTEAIFNLYYGRNIEEVERTQFKIAETRFGNSAGGSSKGIGFQVVFLHKNWEELSAVKRNRAWYNTRYSDIILDILGDKEYKSLDVEQSFRIPQNVLQSSETDSSLIQNIKGKATPGSQDGHYEYCGTLDGRFFFKSTYSLIRDGIEKYKNNEMITLRMGGHPSERERELAYRENGKVPISFSSFSNNERYADYMSNGASKIETGYYDWHNKRYVRRTRKISDLNATMLSEKTLIKEEADFLSKKMFGGRDPDVESIADNLMSGMALSMQDISIGIEGSFHLHCGEIVEVMIPSNPETDVVPYNELYSGFYMIREVVHTMRLDRATGFSTSLSLVRHGVDSKTLEGYAKSKRGRFSL